MKAIKEWRSTTLGEVCKFSGGNGFREELQGCKDGDYPFIKVSDMELQDNKKTIVDANNWIDAKTKNQEAFKVFPENSVVFAKVGAALLLNRRRILTRPTCIDNNMMVAIPNCIDSLFLFYILSNIDFADFVQSGAVPSINQRQIADIHFSLPQLKEQTKIAEILSTVDLAIEQTEALIAKQKRIKTGLMQDLLTRGIDEHGNLRSEQTHEFKDSPLGRIPVEWEVACLGEVSDISSGITLGKNHVGPNTVELPYLRVANVQDGYLNLKEVKTIRIPASNVERYALKAGDVLMNEGGDFDKLGRGAVWKDEIEPCLHQNHVFKVRPKAGKLSSEYLATVSASPYGKSFFILASKQSTNLASINSTQLRSFPIPLPRYEEQLEIEILIKQCTSTFNETFKQYLKMIRLKNALMQDLLTGKKRVTPLLSNTKEEPT